jgi:bifunctional NMN adenylyltransferase/nudix hydrolase
MGETDRVNIGVYIGRFAPFHKAHEAIVRDALCKCDILILCLGNHSIDRTQRDPWIAIERIAMIKSCFTTEELRRIKFYPLITYGNMTRWTADIIQCVDNFRSESDTLGIFGCTKDESSWYLNEFPAEFRQMFLDSPLYCGLSSTDVRKEYFENRYVNETTLPQGVVNYLKNYIPDFNYQDLLLK